MLNWSKQFNIFCFLDNQGYDFSAPEFSWMLAAGSRASCTAGPSPLEKLHDFISAKEDWIFGHLAYDLKEKTGGTASFLPDPIGFPHLHFFVPAIIIRFENDHIDIGSFEGEQDNIFDQITNYELPYKKNLSPIEIKQRFSRDEYLQTISTLRDHIKRGDCYEINFCQEFYAEDVQFDPLQAYLELSRLSPNPFSSFYKMESGTCSVPARNAS